MTDIHRFAAILLVVLSLLGTAACSRQSCEAHLACHVVVISLDTTRADHFGFYGNESVATPNLDRLAAESIVLDDFMTVAPTTLASHASLFTGNYPQTHGTPRNGFVVHEDNVTMAEIFSGHGFVTAGVAGSYAISSRFRIDQGFDYYDESFDRMAGEDGRFQNERNAEAVTDAVIDHLDRIGVPQHLFLFAHYFDPHAPYAAPEPYDTMYDPRGAEGLPGWYELARDCSGRGGEKTPEAERMALQYASEISYMDHHVGRLLDDLRARGILDSAVVIVTSDHGENFWEHLACFDHGWSVFQTTMRSVGIVRLPGGEGGGRRIERLAASVDILPTLLEAVGIDPVGETDGSPIDLADGSRAGSGPRFGQATKPWEQVETDPRWTNMLKARFVREGRFKLVQVPYAQQEQLYDLDSDPNEQTDLLVRGSREVAERAEEMRRKLEEWAASARPLPAEFDEEHRDETIERLRALGYLGGN